MVALLVRCTKTTFWQVAFIAFAVFALRSPTLVLSVIDWDETAYALVAREMLSGHLPYSVAFDHKPIALYYHFAAIMFVGGDNPIATRALSLFLVFGSALILRNILSRHIGLATITSTIIAVGFVIANSGLGGLSSNSEHVVNFYTLAWLALILSDRSNRNWRLFFVGALMAISFQSNYLTGFILMGFSLGFLAFILLKESDLRNGLKLYLNCGCWILFGFILTNIILLLPLLIWGDISSYFSMQYQFLQGYDSDENILHNLQGPFRFFIPFLLVFIVLFIIGLRKDNLSRNDVSLFVLIFAIIIGTLAAIFASGRFYPHYFIFLYPTVFILFGFLINLADLKKSINYGIIVIALGVCLSVISATIISIGGKATYQYIAGQETTYDVPRIIAKRGSKYLSENDTVYVVCAQPVIYQLLNVTAPTKYPFFIHHFKEEYADGFGFKVSDEVNQILDQFPKVVVLGEYYFCRNYTNKKNWDHLRNELSIRGYQAVQKIAERTIFVLFDRKSE